MLHLSFSAFFHLLFISPLDLLLCFLYACMIGSGFSVLYLGLYSRHVEGLPTQQGRSQVRLFASLMLSLGSVCISVGLLLFILQLIWFSFEGILRSVQMVGFIVIWLLLTLLVTLALILIARRSVKRLERRLGVAPQQQAARSGAQPKEAREEE